MTTFSVFKNKLQKYNTPLYNDSMWAIIGNVSLRGLGLLGSIFVARFLGSEIFGEYGAIKNTIVSIAIFSTYGLGYTATKYVADLYKTNPNATTHFIKIALQITLICGSILSIFTLLFSNWIAAVILNAAHLSTLIMYVSVWVVFNALTTLQIGILSGFGEYKAMAKINTIVGLFTFLSSVILTWFYKLEGAILALIISQVFNWFLYYRLVKKNSAPLDKIKVDQDHHSINYKSILSFSFPIALQEMIYSLTSWLSCLLIIKYSTYSELGLYTASAQWGAVVLFIPAVLRNVVLSNLSKEKEMDSHNSIMKKMIWLNIICTLIPILFILFFSGIIVGVYGETFVKLKNVLFVALGSTIFVSINNVYSQAYMSLGRNWLMFFLRLLRDGLTLLLTFCFIIKYPVYFGGALALVWATLIANVVFMILMGYIYSITPKPKNS